MKLRLLTAVVGLVLSSSLALAGPPAAIPEDDSQQRTLRSFKSFASSWMEKMERVETSNRARPKIRPHESGSPFTYKGYASDFDIEVKHTGYAVAPFDIEIKHTGYAAAPFVGILRYSEQLFTCTDASASRCRIVSTIPVTEIFRFQGGRWIY
jgi:hypothetical protein